MSFKGTYSDITIHFKNGGSVIVRHDTFCKIVNALNGDAVFYTIELKTESDGLVPVGIINLAEIAYTEILYTVPSFPRENV